MQKYNNRSEVPEEFKWDLTPFFKNDDEWEECYNKVSELALELKEYVGCTKDADKLYEFMNKQIETVALWEDLYVYAHLVNDQELGVSESLVRKSKAENLEAIIMGIIQGVTEFLPISSSGHLSIGKENTIPRIILGKDTISKELFLNNSNKFVLLNVNIFFNIIIKSFKFSVLNITQPILIKNIE